MELGAALLAGLIGGLAFLVVLWDAILGGVLEVPFLRALGGLVAPHASTQASYVAGAAIHAGLSVGFALVYAWILDALDPATVGAGAAVGLLIGLAHAAAATFVAAAVLSRLQGTERETGPHGLTLGTHQRAAATTWVLAHVVFGLTVGTVYMATAT